MWLAWTALATTGVACGGDDGRSPGASQSGGTAGSGGKADAGRGGVSAGRGGSTGKGAGGSSGAGTGGSSGTSTGGSSGTATAGSASAGKGGASTAGSGGSSGGTLGESGAGAGGEVSAGAGGEVDAGAAGEGGAGAAGAGGTAAEGGTGGAGGAGTSGTGGLGGSSGGGSGTGGTAGATCTSETQPMTPALHPVDVIWAVDNSASQAPAIDEIERGLNPFATLLANQALDYRIVMLSLRSETSPISVNGSTRYAVCIPPPLAGDTHCANGPSFFQSSIDMRSTQMLEQVLGTFGQTAGYQPGDQRGGEAWAQALRPDASKSFVVVTDDNSRLSADQFETFAGGQNPFNSTTLPPGILNAAHAGMFEDYQFDGIYGWGSASNPATRCQYADTTLPTSAGEVYTSLVGRTGGVRAQICSSANWSPFFDAVATAVATAARIACEVPLPAPASAATLLAGIELSGTQTTLLTEVATPEACGASAGFYRESDTSVTLCPASCDTARSFVGPRRSGSLHARYECPAP